MNGSVAPIPTRSGRIARMSVRVRVTLAFAGVMLVVLAAIGGFLYVRFASELDDTINTGLRSRAGDVTALVRQADEGLGQTGTLTERGESFAQILEPDGRIADSTPALRGRRLLTTAQLRRAGAGTIYVETDVVAGFDEPARLLATPVRAQGRTLVVVVGASLEDRVDALRSLASLLLIGGVAALLLASAAGYGAVAAALRPVERMSRRAREISAAAPGRRLPIPPSRDEVGRLGETLNDMLQRLEESFARERRFVSDASHELRTPLAILEAELELALRAGRSPEELGAALRSAADETDRLAQLAEDLLVIARSDQGHLPVRRERVEVLDLLARARERFARRAKEQGVAIAVNAPGAPVVDADPVRLEQALANMLDNALRHGGGSDVTLLAERRGEGVELHVTDGGPGFPDGFIEEAFERFTRADEARSRGGSGLGLAIVAAIAQAHGGTVGAANREPGADVWISVPLARECAERTM